MKYHIFCKNTHKLLAVYSNKETLKTLDTSRCYYKEVVEEKQRSKRNEYESGIKGRSNKIQSSNTGSSQSTDYMNPLNPLSPMYHATIGNDYSSSNSCDSSYSSSSSSSYDSSSSSSCDSSSY